MGPSGIMFHHFHDQKRHALGQGSISARDFEDMIEFLGRKNIVDAEEWMTRALADPLSLEGRFCVTFDDALLCQFDIAKPVLDRLGIKAFWFVYSSIFEGNIERLEIYRTFRNRFFESTEAFYAAFYASTERSGNGTLVAESLRSFNPESYLAEFSFYTAGDRTFRFVRDKVLKPERYRLVMDQMIVDAGTSLQELRDGLWLDDSNLKTLRSDGHIIGLHSYSHPTELTSLPPEEKNKEYQLNFAHLSRVMGEKPVTVSHPCNSYDAECLAQLRSLGIRLGFRANMADVVGRTELEFPRQDHAILKAKLDRR